MVLESIFNPPRSQKHPFLMFLAGAGYATLAIVLSLWIFEDQASMVFVFLTSLAMVPLMYHTLNFEERRDIIAPTKSIVHNHAPALTVYLMMFLGCSFAFTLWYTVLPPESAGTLFQVQAKTITSLNQHITGNITQTALLSKIFLNNTKVLIFCILFSFLYGAGAIFILTWNASVIGAAAGNFIRTNMAQFADAIGFHKIAAYLYVASLSILRYAVHGIPEIFSYIIAALAGGILSMAIVRHDMGTKEFENVLLDVSDLVLLSVLVLFIAGIIEVFVTPTLF
ncbi:hypothetical protein D6825_02455 [Candidatus Woesearchaeota archaeon]|nr:MAG: hypothetical protein D6825_02455 [Candidatus Woesearchaeota archaeon]